MERGDSVFIRGDEEIRWLDADHPATDLGDQRLAIVSRTASPRIPSSQVGYGSTGLCLRGAATFAGVVLAAAAFVLFARVFEVLCAAALVVLMLGALVAHCAGWRIRR